MGRRARRGVVVGAGRPGFWIIAVGRAGPGPERELVERYRSRIRPSPEILACPDGRGSPAEIRRREGVRLLATIPPGALAVALDKEGVSPSSADLARTLDAWIETGRPLAFVIGGAEGLDPAVLARADATLSFGPQTWPHMLARVMLLEQIWRARSISAGHPYHRG